MEVNGGHTLPSQCNSTSLDIFSGRWCSFNHENRKNQEIATHYIYSAHTSRTVFYMKSPSPKSSSASSYAAMSGLQYPESAMGFHRTNEHHSPRRSLCEAKRGLGSFRALLLPARLVSRLLLLLVRKRREPGCGFADVNVAQRLRERADMVLDEGGVKGFVCARVQHDVSKCAMKRGGWGMPSCRFMTSSIICCENCSNSAFVLGFIASNGSKPAFDAAMIAAK